MRTLPPGHDVLLYDGACLLCVRAAGELARHLPVETPACSFRDAGALAPFPGLPPERCEAALQLVREDGEVFSGAEAVVQGLRHRWYGALLRGYYLPVVRTVADAAYRAVARRRRHLSATLRGGGRGA